MRSGWSGTAGGLVGVSAIAKFGASHLSPVILGRLDQGRGVGSFDGEAAPVMIHSEAGAVAVEVRSCGPDLLAIGDADRGHAFRVFQPRSQRLQIVSGDGFVVVRISQCTSPFSL